MKRWPPPDNILAGILFVGSVGLLKLLDRMIRRPRRWHEKNLPILYLSRTGRNTPLEAIAYRLAHARQRAIVHARVPARPPASGSPAPERSIQRIVDVRSFVDSAVTRMAGKRPRVRKLAFPRYQMASWLVGLYTRHQPPDPAGNQTDQRTAQLQAFLQRRDPVVTPTDTTIGQLTAEVPWYLILTARWVRLALFMAPLWRAHRWLVRHPSTRALGSDLGEIADAFANRQPSADDVCGVLVDALLADLRSAYGRTRIPGTRRGRLSYPVLLIDGAVAGTPGLWFIEQVGRSRNHTEHHWPRRERFHRWDPLVIVADGDGTGVAELGHTNPLDAADVTAAYMAWERTFHEQSTRRQWTVPIRIPDEEGPPGVRTVVYTTPLPIGRRSIAAGVAVGILLLSTVTGVVNTHYSCGTMPWQPELTRVDLDAGRTQCIGLSDGSHRFFEDLDDIDVPDRNVARDLRRVEEEILDANGDAERMGNAVTVVELGVLSSKDPEGYPQILQELLGLAVAQRDHIERGQPVRIMLANAGDGMAHAPEAADAIAEHAQDDDTLLAVLGLGISKTATRTAMVRLGTARLPMVGTAITATQLVEDTTPFYRQVGPTNRRQAAVIASHAAARGFTGAEIYSSSDEHDLYTHDLQAKLHDAFKQRDISSSTHKYSTGTSPAGDTAERLGERACDLDPATEVAVYAGRAEQMDSFISGMTGRCSGSYPRVIAGDDVSRHLLARSQPIPNGLTVEYAALSTSLAWAGGCTGSTAPPFFKALEEFSTRHGLSGSSRQCEDTRDGQAMLSYDSLDIVMKAIGSASAGNGRPSPDAVLGQMEQIQGHTGVTGIIDYRNRARAPHDKAVFIVEVSGAAEPRSVLRCGAIGGQVPPENPGCPHEGDD
jgi:hypothetical protein